MRALCLGGAACLFDDLAALGDWEPDLVVACNDAGTVYPGRLDHWVTLHSDKMRDWMEVRRRNGGNTDCETWAQLSDGGRHRLIAQWEPGSSGLLAVTVAFKMGATEAVLCGIPLEPAEGHFFDAAEWEPALRYREAWEKCRDRLAGRVFSMSGWTREMLGPPPWLLEQEAV